MDYAFEAELDWMKQSAVSRAEIAQAGGEIVAQQAQWSTIGNWFSIGTKTVSLFS